MIFIAHRGNLNGPHALENHPDQIDECLKLKFDCEIDLWVIEKKLFLGHDVGQYSIDVKWLLGRRRNLWIHCKNMQALELMKSLELEDLNFFWHENDSYVQTSTNVIWVFPGKRIFSGSIAVLPETWLPEDSFFELSSCSGICTDFVIKYESKYNSFAH